MQRDYFDKENLIVAFVLGILVGAATAMIIMSMQMNHQRELFHSYIEKDPEAVQNLCKYEGDCELLREQLPKDERD